MMDTKVSVTYFFNNGSTQHTNMTLDAYEYFTSEENIPHRMAKRMWKKMSTTKRLEYYLDEMKTDIGAFDVSYKILKTI